MSSSEFRHLFLKGEPGRPDRLFRAAVSAFCSLPRPSRREIDQLEDLALPLMPDTTTEARRFVAAALSECEVSPPALVKRLTDETVDIAAPLLIRSAALSDADLIAVIARHGLSHARAIARRPGLNPTIAALIRALSAGAPDDEPIRMTASNDGGDTTPRSEADRVRQRLLTFMRPADPAHRGPKPIDADGYGRLVETALSGNPASFQTALSDFIGIGFREARQIVVHGGTADLATALKALDLAEEQAFLLAVALRPGSFDHVGKIRAFLDLYRTLTVDEARRSIMGGDVASRSSL